MGFRSLFGSGLLPRSRPKKGESNTLVRTAASGAGTVNINIAYAFEMARHRYEEEERKIMRDELTRRSKNQAECQRRMQGADQKFYAEQARLAHFVASQTRIAVQQYRADKISAAELAKRQRKNKKRADLEWASFLKWHRQEKMNAQKVFFTKGELIGIETGAALRHARDRLEAAKRMRK